MIFIINTGKKLNSSFLKFVLLKVTEEAGLNLSKFLQNEMNNLNSWYELQSIKFNECKCDFGFNKPKRKYDLRKE